MKARKNKIEKYTIFIMPYSLHESSGLDFDATLEEVREFARKHHSKVAQRTFTSERECLVYFTALCDSGGVFGDNIYYYLFTDPEVEPVDEPILTWMNLTREFLVPSRYKMHDFVVAMIRKLAGLNIDGIISDDDKESLDREYEEDKNDLFGYISGMCSSLSITLSMCLKNYFFDKYIGYIDPEKAPREYVEFMKEYRDYPELRDE